jgi:hypothetical protein
MKLDLSCAEHTLAGDFLGTFIYNYLPPGNFLNPGEYRAFPHNGGVHTLVLTMSAGDIEAFLGLVEEQCSKIRGCDDFVRQSRDKLYLA